VTRRDNITTRHPFTNADYRTESCRMALSTLAHDPRLLRTRLVVIDFEGLTPAGQSPVPTEVAAITLLH
jgi:hypothetical protein